MLNRPIVTLHAIAPDGVEHVVDVMASESVNEVPVYSEQSVYVVTTDCFITDASDPRAYVIEEDEDPTTHEPPFPLSDGAHRMCAGMLALKEHLNFVTSYGSVARRFQKRKPKKKTDDDDGLSSEGVSK